MKNGFAPNIIANYTYSERNMGTKVVQQSLAGFTLMELLVYMMIVGIIVIVAGQAFTDSTKFRIRTQNMLAATQEAENVASLFKADVSQMGAKSSKETTVAAGDDTFENFAAEIYIDPDNVTTTNKDSSSYFIQHKEAGKYDSIAFLHVRYDNNGTYQAVEKVEWYVENEILKRACRLITKKASFDATGDPCSNGANSTPTAVEMATGVKRFLVYPGLPDIRSTAATGYQEEQIFPQGGGDEFKFYSRHTGDHYHPLTIGGGGTSVTISGFTDQNYDEENAQIKENSIEMNQVYAAGNEDVVSGNWANASTSFTLEPGLEYEISFSMSYPSSADDKVQLFVPGRDHMSVGFRTASGDPVTEGEPPQKIIDDFLFYPPTNKASERKRTMRFTVPKTLENLRLAFTFAIYSPVANEGTVTISDLKLRRVASSTYDFGIENLPIKDKKNVKALKLELAIERGGKNGNTGESDTVKIVIPTPSNGPRD